MKTMKKLLYSVMLLALAAGYTSCEDDNDDNPVLVKATEFVLNTPAFVNQQIDLRRICLLDRLLTGCMLLLTGEDSQ